MRQLQWPIQGVVFRKEIACEQAPGLEERSKFIGRRDAPTVRVMREREACSQARKENGRDATFLA